MDEERDELIEQIARELRQPVTVSAGFDVRVMAAVRAAPRGMTPADVWGGLRRPRTIMLSPLSGLAMAAALAALVLVGSRILPRGENVVAARSAATTSASDSLLVVQFVLVTDASSSVSVVGDFNDWDVRALPLARSSEQGVWSATVALPPGRYRYTFVVDGERWVADPSAPRTIEDDFGRPSSILTVTRRAS